MTTITKPRTKSTESSRGRTSSRSPSRFVPASRDVTAASAPGAGAVVVVTCDILFLRGLVGVRSRQGAREVEDFYVNPCGESMKFDEIFGKVLTRRTRRGGGRRRRARCLRRAGGRA